MQELVIKENGTLEVSDKIAQKLKQIKDFQVMKVEMENEEKLIKQQLLNAMKATGVTKVSLEGVGTFSYVRPTTRTTFDSKRFKVDQPELYSQYTRISPVNDSVKVTYED